MSNCDELSDKHSVLSLEIIRENCMVIPQYTFSKHQFSF